MLDPRFLLLSPLRTRGSRVVLLIKRQGKDAGSSIKDVKDDRGGRVKDDREGRVKDDRETERRLRGVGVGLLRGLLNHIEVFLGDEVAIGKQPELIPARSRKHQGRQIHAEIVNLQPVFDFDRRQ